MSERDPVAVLQTETERDALAESYRAEAGFLRGLCYRLTGDASAAEDLVQETFVRALQHRPEVEDGTLRPWLVHVATNLGRDHLRRRRRRRYIGPWLPSPIDTGDAESPPAHEPVVDGGRSTEGRYDLLESVSFAFLLALEALTPKQRAVLLLRDVFDYTVAETAAALDASEADVKTSHHQARRAMAAYDRRRCVPTRLRQERTRAALAGLLEAFGTGDSRRAEELLASSVRALSDGGGEFFAARVPVVGPARVARFYANLAKRRPPRARMEVRMLNGLPAMWVETGSDLRGTAPRFATLLDVDESGRVVSLHSVLATTKLLSFTMSGNRPVDPLATRLREPRAAP